jgi:GNAT superfamily N-acetyltransferase
VLTIEELEGDDEDLGALLHRGGLPATARDLASGLTTPEWVIGARTEHGELVGMAFARIGQYGEVGGPVCLLHQVIVDAGHRRHGVGTALVAHVMDDARRRGARRIRLEMYPLSQRAVHRAFYDSLGFGPGDDGPDTLAAEL